MLHPASTARLIASYEQNIVVAIPFTTVSGPPNLNVSRYVCSRHGNPRCDFTRATTSPAVNVLMLSASSRDRLPKPTSKQPREQLSSATARKLACLDLQKLLALT